MKQSTRISFARTVLVRIHDRLVETLGEHPHESEAPWYRATHAAARAMADAIGSLDAAADELENTAQKPPKPGAVRVVDPEEYEVNLYDSTGDRLLKTEYAVDITAKCDLGPDAVEGERVLVLYTTSKRGRVVVFHWENPAHGDVTRTSVNLDGEGAGRIVDHYARTRLNMSGELLMSLARKYAPPVAP